ncbi:MAG TPA: AzlD domain-containing protein [Ktedonobacterales bacterium]
MEINPLALLTILGMGAVTYATRIGGFWLLGRVTPTRRVEAWMRAIPGAVLVSLIAPALLAAGVVGFIAAAATVVIAARTHRLLPALVAGVVIVAVARLVFHAG